MAKLYQLLSKWEKESLWDPPQENTDKGNWSGDLNELLYLLRAHLDPQSTPVYEKLRNENAQLKRDMAPALMRASSKWQKLRLVSPFERRIPCVKCSKLGVLYHGTENWFMIHNDSWNDSKPGFQFHNLGSNVPKGVFDYGSFIHSQDPEKFYSLIE